MRGFHKLDMASTDWLTTHFLAKSPDRFRDVASLPIKPGFRVLDLCCGPGLYLPHLLDLAGATGHVIGMDEDPTSLDAAHLRLSALPHRNWELQHSSFDDYVPKIRDQDVVLMFNSIGYFPDPRVVVDRVARRLRPGATFIIKDFDLESFFFHPRDPAMWSRLISAAKAKNDTDNPVSFDNFFGRKVHTLHRAYTFRDHWNSTWTQLMTHPFNAFQREYLWRNIECLLKQAGPDCPTDVADYFRALFYPPDATFFAHEDAIFVEVEYLTYLRL